MTLTKCIQLSLANAGLSSSSATFVDKARDYINLGMKEISATKQWRWLYKEETITVTASTSTYNLATDCLRPLAFQNPSDDFEMRMVDNLKLDRVDPDNDLSAGAENAAVVNWDSTNTAWTVRFWPIPDTNSETVKHRYYAYIADWTSSNDASELDTLGIPDWTQTALMYWAASKVMEEKQDHEGSQLAMQSYRQMLNFYAEADEDMSGSQGNITNLMRQDAYGFGDFQFKVQGSLT